MTKPDKERPQRFGRQEGGRKKEDRTAQWREERTAVLRALEGFPDARAEVVRELQEACKRHRN